jgi:hypothetical protein
MSVVPCIKFHKNLMSSSEDDAHGQRDTAKLICIFLAVFVTNMSKRVNKVVTAGEKGMKQYFVGIRY